MSSDALKLRRALTGEVVEIVAAVCKPPDGGSVVGAVILHGYVLRWYSEPGVLVLDLPEWADPEDVDASIEYLSRLTKAVNERGPA